MRDIHQLSGRLGNEMFRDAYIYSQVREGNIPDIYCQDFKLFEKYADEIRQRYSDGIGLLPYVAIHLRRGDYVGNSFYTQLWETGYYINAINLFEGRQFLVFTDDLPFAQQYFTGDKFAFDDSLDAVEALNKMASCDGIITANSSLSWWGAFLNKTFDKKVYPLDWFTDKVERVTFPQDWIGII
jgi:hypothetical protein